MCFHERLNAISILAYPRKPWWAKTLKLGLLSLCVACMSPVREGAIDRFDISIKASNPSGRYISRWVISVLPTIDHSRTPHCVPPGCSSVPLRYPYLPIDPGRRHIFPLPEAVSPTRIIDMACRWWVTGMHSAKCLLPSGRVPSNTSTAVSCGSKKIAGNREAQSSSPWTPSMACNPLVIFEKQSTTCCQPASFTKNSVPTSGQKTSRCSQA